MWLCFKVFSTRCCSAFSNIVFSSNIRNYGSLKKIYSTSQSALQRLVVLYGKALWYQLWWLIWRTWSVRGNRCIYILLACMVLGTIVAMLAQPVVAIITSKNLTLGVSQWLYIQYIPRNMHGFVVLCFVVVMQSFIMNSHEVFIHIH